MAHPLDITSEPLALHTVSVSGGRLGCVPPCPTRHRRLARWHRLAAETGRQAARPDTGSVAKSEAVGARHASPLLKPVGKGTAFSIDSVLQIAQLMGMANLVFWRWRFLLGRKQVRNPHRRLSLPDHIGNHSGASVFSYHVVGARPASPLPAVFGRPIASSFGHPSALRSRPNRPFGGSLKLPAPSVEPCVAR